MINRLRSGRSKPIIRPIDTKEKHDISLEEEWREREGGREREREGGERER